MFSHGWIEIVHLGQEEHSTDAVLSSAARGGGTRCQGACSACSLGWGGIYQVSPL